MCCYGRGKNKRRAMYKALSTVELEARKVDLEEDLACQIATSTVYLSSSGGLLIAGATTGTLPLLIPAIGLTGVSGSISTAQINKIREKLATVQEILAKRQRKCD